MEEVKIECPFCKKKAVKALFFPSYLKPQVSRISSGSKTVYKRIPERYEIIGDCENCGAKKKKIIENIDGDRKKVDIKKKIENLKNLGLPLVFKS